MCVYTAEIFIWRLRFIILFSNFNTMFIVSKVSEFDLYKHNFRVTFISEVEATVLPTKIEIRLMYIFYS